jgi:hypothetical protein
MAKLDGSEKLAPTPFDAHEQVVRDHHTHSARHGYQPAEYEHAEYPKHVGDVVVASEEEEKAALAAQAEAEAEKLDTDVD